MTYNNYYAAISLFFHSLCKSDSSLTRIDRLEQWISALGKQFNLFHHCPNLVDVATSGSVGDWNRVKGSLLQKASISENGYNIYLSIYESETIRLPILFDKTIKLGLEIFEHMCANKMDSIEFTDFDKLQKKIIKNYDENIVSNVFSLYKVPIV